MLKKSLYLQILSLSCFSLMAMDEANINCRENEQGALSLINLSNKNESHFLPLAAQNPHYQDLFNTAYGFLDFCYATNESLQALTGFKENYGENMENNIESAIFMVNFICLLDQGKMTLDMVLEKILWTRLTLLKSRAEIFGETQEYFRKNNKFPKKYFIPTTPEKVVLLNSRDRMLAEQSIDRYQFINLMIYQLFKLVEDPTKLSRRTKEYLSCSRTLWPILLNETTELSHPDFATITLDIDPQEYQLHKDYNYFFDNYELQNHSVRPMNLGCKETDRMILKLSRFEIAQSAGKRNGVLPLPRPTWLYPIRLLTLELNDVVGLKGGVVTQKEKVTEKITRIKATKRKKTNKDNAKFFGLKNVETKAGNAEETSEKLEPSSQLFDNSQDDPTTNKGKEEIEFQKKPFELVEPKNIACIPDTFLELTRVEQKIPDALLQPKIEDTDIPEAFPESKGAAKETPDLSSQKYTYLHPKGTKARNQKSYKVTPNFQIDNETIKPYEKLIDKIFDYRMHGQGFNFGEFKSMWEHINGKGTVRSSKSGSSHRALLDKSGNVVMGTFAHGDSQTYTRNTVKYLRAALWNIGIEGGGLMPH